jgi:hypothetical protein
MKELNSHLQKFSLIIDDLKVRSTTNNVRIGGSLALKLHGLNFSRPPGDLDVIITNPTKDQKEYLKALKFFDLYNDEERYPNHTNYKFKKDTLILNILVVDYYIDSPYYLEYMFDNKYYSIIDIKEIIQAKKVYKRKKDIEDFLLLKNENFNI